MKVDLAEEAEEIQSSVQIVVHIQVQVLARVQHEADFLEDNFLVLSSNKSLNTF